MKKGDRVIIVRNNSCFDPVDIGQTGTLLEDNDGVPWVQFDTPTRYSFSVAHIPGSKAGFCACVLSEQLELLE